MSGLLFPLPGEPFTYLTLILAWISNHMPSKICDEITYPVPNFNGCTVEVWEWISKFIPQVYDGYIYLSMLGLDLVHVSKMGFKRVTV